MEIIELTSDDINVGAHDARPFKVFDCDFEDVVEVFEPGNGGVRKFKGPRFVVQLVPDIKPGDSENWNKVVVKDGAHKGSQGFFRRHLEA